MRRIALLLLVLLFSSLNTAAAAAESGACQSIEYFFKQGCPHCARAEMFINTLQRDYPQIAIERLDVRDSANVWPRYVERVNQFGIDQPGVPFMVMCDNFVVGYGSPDTTGKLIKFYLGLEESEYATAAQGETLFLPIIGELDVEAYGLPLLTLVIGLIDGFNPCAMWVLLFLLSLLLNLKKRSRIVIVAGSFVLVSGIVYFAFMAAWLNVFLIVGFSRLLQVVVAIIALLIGAIHIKDYFAFKQGVSLSIPEKSKPGLYAHMRRVIYAENLWASLIAVIILAILVNLVELLCTAGLPAVYTHILTAQQLPTLEYYSYLLLYNLAYIFDDALMVTIVVFTLSQKRLQEGTGRILKLISGSVILALGIALLFFPEWLV